MISDDGVLQRQQELKIHVKDIQQHAFRPGTRKNLNVQLRSYTLFCCYYNFKPFPCSEDILCCYVCFLGLSMVSFATVRNYLSGVKTWSNLLDYPTECFQGSALKLTLQGLSKVMSHIPASKFPLTPDLLRQMIQHLDRSNPVDICVWTLLTLGFFGMLRASNLIPRSVASFNPSEQLTRRNVLFSDEGLILKLTWSKTRHFYNKNRLL